MNRIKEFDNYLKEHFSKEEIKNIENEYDYYYSIWKLIML